MGAVPTELEAPNAGDADPTEDTPQTPDADTAKNTPEEPQSQVDWEKRYKDAQAELTRQAQRARALEDRILAGQPTPQGPPPDETPRERALREQLEAFQQQRDAEQWQAALAQLDPKEREAYERFTRGLRLDPSQQGLMVAFREALGALAPKEPPAPKTKPTREQATQPRTDDNRPAPAAQAELDRLKTEAVQKHDPGAWLNAQMRDKWGIGR